MIVLVKMVEYVKEIIVNVFPAIPLVILTNGTGSTCATVVSSSCTDNIKNGAETDVDCGGTCPNKCGDGLGCSVSTDCASKS